MEIFYTSHQSRSDGLEEEGQLCSHSTSRSSAGSLKQIRNPDFWPPTASFGQGGERKNQSPRPQISNDSPSKPDVVDQNPNVGTGLQSGEIFPSGGGDDDGDDDGEEDGDDGGDEGHHPSDDIDTSLCNYDVVRLRVLPHNKESRSALRWPVWHDEGMTTFKVLVYVGEKCRITANDLVIGATFVNMDSIKANPMLSFENGQDLIATFLIPVTDEDQKLTRVPVKMRFSPNAKAYACEIVFDVTIPLRYVNPERILKPRKQKTVFKLEAQPARCNVLSSVQMGQFLLEEGTKGPVLLDCQWLKLEPTSGQLTVKMVDLPKDSEKRTQVFCITRNNQMGEMEKFDVVIEFVKFSFTDIPQELIKAQAINPAILLASTPDILLELRVSITHIGDLATRGFEISGRKLEISGTPNAPFNCQEHEVTITCPGLSDISVKLLLPQVDVWKPPCLTPDTAQITKSDLDKTIKEIRLAAADLKNYQFEEYAEHTTLFKMKSPGYYELTLIMGIQTEVQIEFDTHKLSALEKVKIELYRFVPKINEWVLYKGDTDVSIKAENGHLVIAGTPKAHKRDRKWQIDDSGQRCWHTFAIITPQNMAGDGEVVRLMITCRPLKIFWGVAQTYNYTTMPKRGPKHVEALECCKVDLKNMIEVHRLLGFDVLLSCCDTAGGCIDITRRHVESLVAAVVTADIVIYMSGHGFLNQDGTKTYLLVRDENFSADWKSTHNNLSIEDTVDEVTKHADNSSFLVVIVDACREKLPEVRKKGQHSDPQFKIKISTLFKQQILWWSTSAGLLSMAESGIKGMSRFTGCLHSALTRVAAGESEELMKPPGNDHFLPGILALKDMVHRAVSTRVLRALQLDTNEVEAQVPEYREGKVQEAFTFKLIPFPPFPATLGVLPLHDCSNGTDPRWRTLWEEEKIIEGDYISYLDPVGRREITGVVQVDGRIKYKVRRKDMLFIDAVAFAMHDNTWASLDHHDQSVIDANKKLFSCCHLCQDDDDTIESLEDLLRSCDSHAPSAVLGGVGKGNSSEKGKESYVHQELYINEVEGESGAAQVRKRAREDSPHGPSKQPMVSDLCMWSESEIHYIEYVVQL